MARKLTVDEVIDGLGEAHAQFRLLEMNGLARIMVQAQKIIEACRSVNVTGGGDRELIDQLRLASVIADSLMLDLAAIRLVALRDDIDSLRKEAGS